MPPLFFVGLLAPGPGVGEVATVLGHAFPGGLVSGGLCGFLVVRTGWKVEGGSVMGGQPPHPVSRTRALGALGTGELSLGELAPSARSPPSLRPFHSAICLHNTCLVQALKWGKYKDRKDYP